MSKSQKDGYREEFLDFPSATPFAPVGLGRVDGHFAARVGEWWVRDPLGVQKLFFTLDAGELVARNYAIDLVREGYALEKIWSVPSGRAMRLDPGTGELEMRHYAPLPEACEGDWRAQVDPIRRALEDALSRLAVALEGQRIFVTLSGGLDSSGIAALAREHLRDVTAVTFHVEEDGESDDLRSAREVAAFVGLPLEVVSLPRDALIAGIDDAIVDGQDFRDFNLHCALVNQALAQGIAGLGAGVVLTGDGMNELLCDYTPVEYAGTVYYPLPDLPPGELRRVLVRGLDAGDREVGIFGRRGLTTVQPYLLCANEYLALPPDFLALPGGKSELARAIFEERIPASVYARPKVRAQVASSGTAKGTLATLADRGLTGEHIARRAAALYRCTPETLRSWIRGGMYRFPTRFSQLT